MAESIDAFIVRAARSFPKRIALVTRRDTVTYGQLDQQVRFYAERLSHLGLEAGHRLGVNVAASPDVIAFILGALRLRLMVSLMSMTLGPSGRRHRLHEFDPDLVVGPEIDRLRSALNPLRPPGGCAGTVVFWTSGSTGLAKGVVLTQAALATNARANARVLGLSRDDRALVLLDPAYCYAMVHQIFSHVSVGASIALPDQPVWLPGIGAEVDRLAATTLAVVPSILQMLVSARGVLQKARGLRLLTVGGAGCPEALLHDAQRLLPGTDIRITYGLTEAGPRVCTRRYRSSTAGQPGMVGLPLPGVEVALDDGELLVRSPSMCLGTLVGGMLEPVGDWIRTGDLGSIDSNGEVRISGRIKRIVNRAGIKIAAAEIEAVLRSHPRVKEVRVVAVHHSRLGEVPRAYVVLDGANGSDAGQLARYCAEQLGPLNAPVDIDVVSSLPGSEGNWKDVLCSV